LLGKAGDSIPWQDQCLISCNVTIMQSAEINRHNPHCHFTKYRQLHVPSMTSTPDSGSLELLLGSLLVQGGPPGSSALISRGCLSGFPATDHRSERVGAVLQSCPHHCGLIAVCKGSNLIATEKSLIICRAWRPEC
jgi:hypothetical protein